MKPHSKLMKSADAGLTSSVVKRTDNFKLHDPPGNVAERTVFRAPDWDLFVDVSVNPWSE